MSIGIQDLNQWRGAAVTDRQREKVGSLEAVYVDSATDEPLFAAVKHGLLGFQKITLVPLHGALVGKDDIVTAVTKDLVKDAPSFDTDAEVGALDEPKVYAHYSLEYVPASTPSGRRLVRH